MLTLMTKNESDPSDRDRCQSVLGVLDCEGQQGFLPLFG